MGRKTGSRPVDARSKGSRIPVRAARPDRHWLYVALTGGAIAIVVFALLAFVVAVAGFGVVCQNSLASSPAPIAGHAPPVVVASASSAHRFALAPLNPAFTRYVRSLSLGRLRAGREAHGMGYIPSPIDFSYLKGVAADLGGSTAYPSSYDLRGQGKLSDIEDQGQTGCCWTFATMGSLESALLPSDPESFSEDNLTLNSGFDSSFNQDPGDSGNAYNAGGNALMSTAYLARWAGPVLTSQDGFDDYYTPPGLAAAKHVQDVLYIPPRTSWSDNSAIKAAVMNYGAVYTSMYADDGMCSSSYSEYYN